MIQQPDSARRRPRLLGARLALVAAVAFLASGCLRANVAIEVNEDGSGTASIIQAFDVEALSEFAGEEAVEALEDPESLIPADLPDAVEAEVYEEDGYTGVRFTTAFADVEEMEENLAALQAATVESLESTGATAESQSDGLTLEQTEEGWYFETSGLDSGTTETDDIPEFLLEGFELRYSVTLPGDVVDHNADEVDGTTYTWDLAIDDDRETIFAETKVSKGLGTLPFIIGGAVLALVLLAALGFGLASRKKKKGPTQPAVGAPVWGQPQAPGPSGWPAGPPTPGYPPQQPQPGYPPVGYPPQQPQPGPAPGYPPQQQPGYPPQQPQPGPPPGYPTQ